MIDEQAPSTVLRLGAIPGATPDKWASRWHRRFPEVRLEISYYDDAGQLERVTARTVDLGYVRLREGEDLQHEALHRVWLYTEQPVVCAGADHWIAAAEESVTWEEIAEESFLEPADMLAGQVPDPHQPLDGTGLDGTGLARAERLAVEVAASGAGVVVLPNSTARMLTRKDLVIRTVAGIPGYSTGLAWLKERDSEEIQEFIGLARGRRAESGRSQLEPRQKKRTAAQPAGSRTGSAPQRRGPGTGSRRGRPPRGRRR